MLVLSEDVLYEFNVDDIYGLLEILGLGLDDWGLVDISEINNSLRLEVVEEGERVGSDVSSGVGVVEIRENSGGYESEISNDGSCLFDIDKINSFVIGNFGFDVGGSFVSFS